MNGFSRTQPLRWLLPFLLLAGCSASRFKRSADREAYRLIAEKSAQVTNMEPGFSIDQTNGMSMAGLGVRTNRVESLGGAAALEEGARILTLPDALAIATTKGRTYQTRREQLYLAALALGLARHQWTPLFSGSGHGSFDVRTDQAVSLIPDPADPAKVRAVLSDNLVEQHQAEASGSVNAGWLIRDIGRVSAAFTTDFLRFLTGDPRSVAHSQVAGTFVRPLLRDAGFKQQIENLTQAERDLLYETRDFTRFRKEYSVQVASAYYAVLGNRDAVHNSYANFESSRKNAERTRALAKEGRIAQAELGRLEQQQLSVETSWINAVRNYRQALDDFKLQLGLSIETNIVLEDGELTRLQIRHLVIPLEQAIEVALAARLDYMNSKDQYADTLRKTEIARNFLKPRVDLVASGGFNSGPDTSRGFPLPDPARYNWSAGLDVDLPLDRKAERNAYRAAFISQDRSARELSLREDQIKLQVRESWRTLEQAKRNYEIAELGVGIAKRRVEEQGLLAELGRAKAQDQVDAQNALNDSLNQRTQALVSHTLTRLQFWNNMGILYIRENGLWEEGQPPKVK